MINKIMQAFWFFLLTYENNCVILCTRKLGGGNEMHQFQPIVNSWWWIVSATLFVALQAFLLLSRRTEEGRRDYKFSVKMCTMSFVFYLGIFTTFFLMHDSDARRAYNLPQPRGGRHITFYDTPIGAETTYCHWKMGPFPVGYLIETKNYFIATSIQAVLGQEGQAFGGPGVVDQKELLVQKRIADEATQAGDEKRTIKFTGTPFKYPNGSVLKKHDKPIILMDIPSSK